MADVTMSTPAASSGQRMFAHAVAALIGVLSIVGGIAALTTKQPPVLGVTLLVVSVLIFMLVWKSLQYSRAAWSFLVAMIAVLATVMFFGAPKVATLLGIGLFTAFVFPALKIACVVALVALRRDYRV